METDELASDEEKERARVEGKRREFEKRKWEALGEEEEEGEEEEAGRSGDVSGKLKEVMKVGKKEVKRRRKSEAKREGDEAGSVGHQPKETRPQEERDIQGERVGPDQEKGCGLGQEGEDREFKAMDVFVKDTGVSPGNKDTRDSDQVRC